MATTNSMPRNREVKSKSDCKETYCRRYGTCNMREKDTERCNSRSCPGFRHKK